MKFMTKRGDNMSMTERLLYWIGIVVLVVAAYSLNNQISQIEAKVSNNATTQQGGR